MDGFVNFLKPPGMTSHDAVGYARRQLGEKKVGHAGTLDPGAAGVLPIAVGRAIKTVVFSVFILISPYRILYFS